jgi:hypothetical protein
MALTEFEPIADLAFDIDDELERHRESEPGDQPFASSVIDDKTIELLGRDNRVAISRGAPAHSSSPSVPPGRSYIHVPLRFALQAHPECVYTWARIIVDLRSTQDALIADMSPRDVTDVPLEVETTLGLDLSLSLLTKVVDLGAKPEISRKRTVFFPSVTATGTGFHQAYWDFYPKAGDYLHADKELHLLINAPAAKPVMAGVTVRAKIRFRGLPRLIPMLCRTGGVDGSHPIRLA